MVGTKVFSVQGPDGKIYQIEGPEDATDEELVGQARQAADAEAQNYNYGEDVAKSAGIGVAQGAIGLATLPGNVEALGRAGINAVGGLLGSEGPVVDSGTLLPNYNDVKGLIETKTGEFYKPKSRLGKFARTIGEFGAGGGVLGRGLSAGARLANTAVPAVISETAGQLTEGSALEPWARMAGGVAGSFAPGAAARLRSPIVADPANARHVNILEQAGVQPHNITAGQRTGNRAVKGLEDASDYVPLGGRHASTAARGAAEDFTEAALRNAGIAGRSADDTILGPAYAALGREYDNVRVGAAVRADNQFVNRLERIVQRYQEQNPQATHVPIIGNVMDNFRQMIADQAASQGSRNMMSGALFANTRNRLRAAARAQKGNPAAQAAISDMVTAMDAQVVRSLPRSQRAQAAREFRDLNTRYRNFLAIEDAVSGSGEWAAKGLISPPQLTSAIKRQNKRDYTLGRSELARLARAGNAILKPLPSSGTAERAHYMAMLNAPVGGGAAGLAGAALMGAPGAIAGVGLASVPVMSARAIGSAPVQRWLANQAMAARPEMLSMNAPLAFGAFEAARSFGGPGPLTGSQQGQGITDEEELGAFR